MRLAFLGLGKMGAPMAERLLAAGHALAVHDPVAEAMAPLVAAGARPAASVAEAAQECDIAFACLPDPHTSRAVALGIGGIREAAGLGAYVEMSTIGTAAIEAIAQGLAEAGIPLLDAPVSGGPRGARAGTLAVMVAGAPALRDRCAPALEAIAGRVLPVGDTPGQAQLAKLINNVISAATMAVSFEAVAMGVKAGLDADRLIAAINAGTGRSGATMDKFPAAILPRSFDYGGRMATMHKDVELALAEFRARTVPHPVCAAAAQTWLQGMASEWRDADYTALIRLVEGWSGVTVAGRAAQEG